MNPVKLLLARAFDLSGLNASLLRLQALAYGPHIRTLNYHDIPPSQAEAFESQLRFFAERFAPVGYEDLLALQEGRWSERRPGLILSFAEHKGVAELLPDIAQMTGAEAVLVAVDKEAWLPKGLARQLIGWLAEMDVACVTPTPLCSLTEQDYGLAFRQRIPYESAAISEFACHFGQPDLQVVVDPQTRTIAGVAVQRDAVCGCARYVAEQLVGVSVDEAEEKAGLLHHHYPCLASMMKIPDFNGDTLMHVSGRVLKDNVGEQVKPYKQTNYIVPDNRSEGGNRERKV